MVRSAASAYTRRTFSQEAAPFLIEMLKDDSDSIRANAKRSLEEIADYLDARKRWQKRLK